MQTQTFAHILPTHLRIVASNELTPEQLFGFILMQYSHTLHLILTTCNFRCFPLVGVLSILIFSRGEFCNGFYMQFLENSARKHIL